MSVRHVHARPGEYIAVHRHHKPRSYTPSTYTSYTPTTSTPQYTTTTTSTSSEGNGVWWVLGAIAFLMVITGNGALLLGIVIGIVVLIGIIVLISIFGIKKIVLTIVKIVGAPYRWIKKLF